MSSKNLINSCDNLAQLVGSRLRIFAKKYFKTIRGLANALSMTEQNLSQYVKGKSLPGALLLLKLSEKGCDIHWLLTGEEIEYTEKGFNNLVNISRAFLRLKELEIKHEALLKQSELQQKEIEELKSEREKVLKMLNK
jgi:transcriptional regulator with XRE-family HTH domain